MVGSLVAVSCGIVFGANNKTASLGCATVHSLDEINHFLLAVDGPVDFVIIACAKIDHNMLVSVEKHNSARIIELVHLVKVGYLSRVDQVHDGKVFDALGYTKECLVHYHTRFVPVMSKAQNYDAVFFRQNGLIDMPPCMVRVKSRTCG